MSDFASQAGRLQFKLQKVSNSLKIKHPHVKSLNCFKQKRELK